MYMYTYKSRTRHVVIKFNYYLAVYVMFIENVPGPLPEHFVQC